MLLSRMRCGVLLGLEDAQSIGPGLSYASRYDISGRRARGRGSRILVQRSASPFPDINDPELISRVPDDWLEDHRGQQKLRSSLQGVLAQISAYQSRWQCCYGWRPLRIHPSAVSLLLKLRRDLPSSQRLARLRAIGNTCKRRP